jgi:nitroimidazol reductase NimA-like FMN-containing flavoprotein (pyridoxamine 5'-phosphate oxidase superfamily)
MTTRETAFRELERTEIEEMLERHAFGRLAFTFHNRVDIEPIGYVYHDGWIYGRTAPGTKLTVLAHHPWVAFEIDEVKGPLSWRSVVVKGTIYFLESGGNAANQASFDEAVQIIRRLTPEAFTDRDRTPERTTLFRLHVDEYLGRAAE